MTTTQPAWIGHMLVAVDWVHAHALPFLLLFLLPPLAAADTQTAHSISPRFLSKRHNH